MAFRYSSNSTVLYCMRGTTAGCFGTAELFQHVSARIASSKQVFLVLFVKIWLICFFHFASNDRHSVFLLKAFLIHLKCWQAWLADLTHGLGWKEEAEAVSLTNLWYWTYDLFSFVAQKFWHKVFMFEIKKTENELYKAVWLKWSWIYSRV